MRNELCGAWALALTAALLLAGCGGALPTSEITCGSDADCPAGERCIARQCLMAAQVTVPSPQYLPDVLVCTRTRACALPAPQDPNGLSTTYAIHPRLPAGLGLDVNTGAVAGTPSDLSPETTYAVSATDALGVGTAKVRVTVNDLPPTDLMYSPAALSCTKGVACTLGAPSAQGGRIVSFAVTPALPGLTLDPKTGAISGTPAVLSSNGPYLVTGTNTGGSTSTVVMIAVNDAAPTALTYSPSTLTCTVGTSCVLAAPTWQGGAALSFTIAPPLPPGLALDSATGAISGVAAELAPAAKYVVAASNSGGATTAELTVAVDDVAPQISYSPAAVTCARGVGCQLAAPSSTGGAVVLFTIEPALPAGLNIDPITGVVSGVPFEVRPAESYTVQAANTGGVATATVSVTVNDLPPADLVYSPGSVTCTLGTSCLVGAPSSRGGAVVSFTVDPPLPAGLVLDPATGAISGIPTAVSPSVSCVVTASNSGGATTATVAIGVRDAAPAHLRYTPSTLVCAQGVPCSLAAPTNDGGRVAQYAIDSPLPDGLSFDPQTGAISGTPTGAAAEKRYVVTASNGTGEATATLTLTVAPAAPTGIVYTPASLVCTIGVTCGLDAPATRGGAIDSFSIQPALPPGLRLSSQLGAITGTPTALSSRTSYVITGSNVTGSTSVPVQITVVDVPPAGLNYSPDSLTCTRRQRCSLLAPTSSGGAVTSFAVSPSLPEGLVVDPVTGAIYGMPTVIASSRAYTVTGANSGGSTTTQVDIGVNDVPPSAMAYSPDALLCTMGSACALAGPANQGGAVVAFSIVPALPQGLLLDPQTGRISGIATVLLPPTSFAVTGANSGGSTTATLTVTVNDVPPSSMTYVPNSLTCTEGSACDLPAPSYAGGAATGFSVDPPLPPGLTLAAATGEISGVPAALAPAATYTVTASNSGGSTTAAVQVTVDDVPPSALFYAPSALTCTRGSSCALAAPSAGGGAITQYRISPTLPPGLAFDPKTGVIAGTPQALLPSTTYTVTGVNSGGSTTATVTITVNDVAPSIAYATSTLVCTKGTLCSLAAPASSGGAVVSFSISRALPAGLQFDTKTGAIAGTPTVLIGGATYTVTATNTGGSQAVALTVIVNDVVPSELIYSPDALVCTIRVYCYLPAPTHRGGAVTSYGISGALPWGLTFNSWNGAIYGTPYQVWPTRSYTVTASNSGGSAVTALTVTVNNVAPPAIRYATSTLTCTTDAPCSLAAPTNTGGPIQSLSISPALPSGMTLSTSTGALSGTPRIHLAATLFTVTAANAGGTSTAQLAITVNDPPAPSITYAVTKITCHQNLPCSIGAPTNGGGAIRSFSVAPSLPAGLWLDPSTGAISGTPTVTAAEALYTVTAANPGGAGAATLDITVLAQPPTSIAYNPASVLCTLDVPCRAAAPSHTGGAPTSYAIASVLPAGLLFDPATGAISGTPTGLSDATTYTVTGSNSGGAVTTTVTLRVQAGPTAVSAGLDHTCAVMNFGVQCWGYNHYGELGDGSTTDRLVPTQVSQPQLQSGASLVAGGWYHMCAATKAGAAWCWGYNSYGQLGDGTTTDSPVPLQVTGLSSGVTAMAGGYYHTCAVVSGAVMCWGYNSDGQLGDGTTDNSSTPVHVQGLLSGGVGVASSVGSSCAVTSSGAALCWGYNGYGQLGDGEVAEEHTPVPVLGLSSGVQQIAAGGYHACALVGGGVQCWGDNGAGQLGDGTTVKSSVPVQVVGLENGVTAIAVGVSHACALLTDGSVECWGYNAYGQLGTDSVASSSVPVQVSGLAAGAQAITAGGNHTCAVLKNGTVECWGEDGSGQLGNDSTTNSSTPVLVGPWQ